MSIDEISIHRKIKENLQRSGWKELPESVFKEHQLIENYIFEDILSEQIVKINATLFDSLTTSEKEEVLKAVKDEILNRDDPVRVLEYLKKGVSYTLKRGAKGNFEVIIKLIDYENPENNVFHYGHETKFKGFPENSKPDFTLFVNGIPLVIIEAKREFSKDVTVLQAVSDIRNYELRSPRLFNFVQFGVVYGDQKGYIPTLPNPSGENRDTRYEVWRNERKEKDIFSLLEPSRVLEIIRDFTFFVKDKETVEKIIPRYMQYYAVKRAFSRIEDYLSGGEKGRGLIWHWQGSGKTYEILFLTELFIDRFLERNPHVFIVIDREELEEQMEGILKNVAPARFTSYFKVIESVNDLKEELKAIKRQEETPALTFKSVSLVMAHKFQMDVYEEFKDLGGITKKEILILRDEAHRTEYGILASVRKAIISNAINFGFTGTPVNRRERNTFFEFAYPEEGEFYLDKYFVEDSIRDGFTLPIVWRALKPRDIYVVTEDDIREILRDFGVEEAEAPVTKVREALGLSAYLESEEHIREASEYIAENIEEDTEGFRFKAFVVASSRAACVKYKRFLDEKLTERHGGEAREWTEVVMTHVEDESKEEIRDFRQTLEQRYKKTWKEINKQLREKFKDSPYPRVLIVTDMLLTGYDASVLKVMYVDKLMKDHQLLQAVARVNRPAEGKRYGIVVDLTGHLIKLYTDALAQYNLYEDEEITKDLSRYLFIKVEKIWDGFLERYERFKSLFKGILGKEWDNEIKALEEGEITREEFEEELSTIAISERLEEFLEEAKETITHFKALGSYPQKVEYYKKVFWVEVFYLGVKRKLRKKVDIPVDWKRVREEVFRRLKFDPFEELFTLEINADTMERLKDKKKTVVLVADLLYLLINEMENRREPIYRGIYEALLRLKERLTKEPKKIKETLDELLSLKRQKESHDREYSHLDFAERVTYNLKHLFRWSAFDETRSVLKQLQSKNLITPSDRKRLVKAMHKDLIGRIEDATQRDREINRIVEEFIKPFMEAWIEERRIKENV
jgi:type I restriction enzyme R subunit